MNQKHGVSALDIIHGGQHVRSIGASDFIRRVVFVDQLLAVLKNAHVAVTELQHVSLRTVEYVGNETGFFIAVFGRCPKASARSADNAALHDHYSVFDNLRTVGVAGDIDTPHQARGHLSRGEIGFYEVRAHVRTSTHR